MNTKSSASIDFIGHEFARDLMQVVAMPKTEQRHKKLQNVFSKFQEDFSHEFWKWQPADVKKYYQLYCKIHSIQVEKLDFKDYTCLLPPNGEIEEFNRFFVAFVLEEKFHPFYNMGSIDFVIKICNVIFPQKAPVKQNKRLLILNTLHLFKRVLFRLTGNNFVVFNMDLFQEKKAVDALLKSQDFAIFAMAPNFQMAKNYFKLFSDHIELVEILREKNWEDEDIKEEFFYLGIAIGYLQKIDEEIEGAPNNRITKIGSSSDETPFRPLVANFYDRKREYPDLDQSKNGSREVEFAKSQVPSAEWISEYQIVESESAQPEISQIVSSDGARSAQPATLHQNTIQLSDANASQPSKALESQVTLPLKEMVAVQNFEPNLVRPPSPGYNSFYGFSAPSNPPNSGKTKLPVPQDLMETLLLLFSLETPLDLIKQFMDGLNEYIFSQEDLQKILQAGLNCADLENLLNHSIMGSLSKKTAQEVLDSLLLEPEAYGQRIQILYNFIDRKNISQSAKQGRKNNFHSSAPEPKPKDGGRVKFDSQDLNIDEDLVEEFAELRLQSLIIEKDSKKIKNFIKVAIPYLELSKLKNVYIPRIAAFDTNLAETIKKLAEKKEKEMNSDNAPG